MADDRTPEDYDHKRSRRLSRFFCYAYCNVQYTVSRRMMTTVLLCIISTVNMEFNDFNEKATALAGPVSE